MENLDKSSPYFLFPTPLPSARLVYERLELVSAGYLLKMFQEDPTPFVSDSFKHAHLVAKYCAHIVRHSRTSVERGGADFFFKTAQGGYAGILHLYDLNQANYGTEQATCTVGFATTLSFRRQGYTLEALRHFVAYIFEHFAVASVVAYTDERNRPAQNLLLRAGFQFMKYDLLQEDLYIYFEIKRKTFQYEV